METVFLQQGSPRKPTVAVTRSILEGMPRLFGGRYYTLQGIPFFTFSFSATGADLQLVNLVTFANYLAKVADSHTRRMPPYSGGIHGTK